jgi:hypothetical protein
MCQCGADYPASTTFGQVHFLREHFVVTTYFRIPDLFTPFLILFNSSLLWDVFIINSVEQLQALPKTHSEIDISPFLKTQKTLL